MHSEVDSNSRTSTSSTSPKCTYIVQSPSHDDKSSTNDHTSPSHSRMSSESRVSGPYQFSLVGKNHHHHQKVVKKKLISVIDEGNENYGKNDYIYDDERVARMSRSVMVLVGFVMVFVTLCLITWGASRPYKLQVQMKSWKLNNFYYGEGSDYTGVPTKLLTINCSVKMNIQNPATFFGIHVSSRPLELFYSKIRVGSGEFSNFYQPKKSKKTISINVEGQKVPLYGVGDGLVVSNNNDKIPLKLDFEIQSHAYLVGPLVTTMHHRRILCIMKIDSQSNEVFDFEEDSCSYS